MLIFMLLSKPNKYLNLMCLISNIALLFCGFVSDAPIMVGLLQLSTPLK